MVRGQTNVQADEQITKLNMLMHRYTHRQAAREGGVNSPRSSKQPEGGQAGNPSSQQAQASSLKTKTGKQPAPPQAGENHYRVGVREIKCTV